MWKAPAAAEENEAAKAYGKGPLRLRLAEKNPSNTAETVKERYRGFLVHQSLIDQIRLKNIGQLVRERGKSSQYLNSRSYDRCRSASSNVAI